MNIREAERFRQFVHKLPEIDDHWNKQVWFWNRNKICRLSLSLEGDGRFAGLSHEDLVKEIIELVKSANNVLHGVGQDGLWNLTIAFKTKKDAMLFKLAHGGS